MGRPLTPKLTPEQWDKVRALYGAGVRSLRSIAEEFGVSNVTIVQRAKRDGWSRDLSERIASKTAEKLSKRQASKESSVSKIGEREIVEANATMQERIILSQREDVSRSRELAMKLLAELEQMTDDKELFSQIGEILREDASDRRMALFNRTIDHSSRVSSMRSLADTLKTLVDLERRVFGIDNEHKPTDPVESLTHEEVEAQLLRLMTKVDSH